VTRLPGVDLFQVDLGVHQEDGGSFSPPALALQLAGVVIAVHCDSAEWLGLAATRLGQHGTQAEAEFTVRYHIMPDHWNDLDPGRLKPGLGYVRSDTASGFEIRSTHFSVRTDLDRREADVFGPMELGPLQVLLRTLLPALVTDGIVMHGAGLADGDRGWVCTGPSGCGESWWPCAAWTAASWWTPCPSGPAGQPPFPSPAFTFCATASRTVARNCLLRSPCNV